jgi:CelD/BcsL family acetyltransferase involved in cellulose biosynthesis
MRSTSELYASVPRWSALWRDDPTATPFQSPEWLAPWWRQFGQDDLRAVAIARDGVWIGFLPFYLYREPYTGEHQLLQIGTSASDYLDGLFAPSCTAAQIRQALELLLQEPGWDVFYASQMPGHSRLYHAVRQMKDVRMRQFEGESCSRMRAVTMAELPQKLRRNTMYYRHHAERLGPLEFQVAGARELAESFSTLCRLHTNRWQERGEPGVLSDERVIAWHREAIPLLEQSGMLRLCALRLNGEIISVLYSLVDPHWRPLRTQYFYLSAFARKHSAIRPGTVLLAMATERAAEEGIAVIDMLRGQEPYKQLWHLEWRPTRGFALENDANEALGTERAA